MSLKAFNHLGPNNNVLMYNFENKKQMSEFDKIPLFYQEVIIGHNTTNNKLKPTRRSEMLDMPLWGNKYIINGNNKVLMFKHWIEQNINTVNDLQFINNRLDVQFVYNILTNKQNWIAEMMMFRNTLLEYGSINKDHKPDRTLLFRKNNI